MAAAGRRPSCTPAGCGRGPRPPPAGPRRQRNLHPTGCPDQGVRRTARRRLPTLPGCPRWVRTCGTWRCRPDGWVVVVRRCPGSLRNRTLRQRRLSGGASATAAACPCWPDGRFPLRTPAPGLPDVLARPSSAGMPPLSGCLAELAGEPVAKPGARQGHRRPLQRQGLLVAQPTEPAAWEVAVLPAADDRAGGRLRGRPRPCSRCQGARRAAPPPDRQGTPARRVSGRGGRSPAHTPRCRPAVGQPGAAARPGRPPAHRPARAGRAGPGAGPGSSPAPGRAPGSRRGRWRRVGPLPLRLPPDGRCRIRLPGTTLLLL